MFDNTINVGTLLQIIAMIGGGIWFLWKMDVKISLLVQRLDNNIKERDAQHTANLTRFTNIDLQLKELIDTTIKIARAEERMDAVDIRIQELSNRIDSYTKVHSVKHPRKHA